LDRLQEEAGVETWKTASPEDIERVSGSNIANAIRHTHPDGMGAGEALRFILNLESVKLSSIRPPTAHEDMLGYRIVVDSAEEVEVAIALLQVDLPGRPVLGTLPSMDVDARELVCRGADGSSEYLVVLDRGLFTFVNLYAKIVAQSAMLDESHVKASSPEVTRKRAYDTLRAFIDLFRAFLYQQDARAAKQYDISDDAYEGYAVVLRAIEQFIIGHEYGHVLEEHAETTNVPAGISTLSTSVARELRADEWGVAILLASDLPLSQLIVGLDAYFLALDILEQTRPRWARLVRVTHPPASERRGQLREILAELQAASAAAGRLPAIMTGSALRRAGSDGAFSDQLADGLRQADVVARVVNGLWQTTRPLFDPAHHGDPTGI